MGGPTFNATVRGTGNPGVQGTSTGGNGVDGNSTSGNGVFGTTTSGFAGVAGSSSTRIGVGGFSSTRIGVSGGSNTDTGVSGTSSGFAGVVGFGIGSAPAGVFGSCSGGTGVSGTSSGGTGVSGTSSTRIGVSGTTSGISSGSIGVFGEGTGGGNAIGVFGQAAPNSGRGGYFEGGIKVVLGPKSFQIDHPLDPENRYLVHTSVESSEMKNVYDGVARLDEEGEASVELPEWFEALNGDLRYQLTAIGGAAPNLHVAEEVSENRFKIAGGEEGMKVCWQVTGTRKDPWATANPFEVEQEKPEEERGRYLDPSLYDAPEEQRVIIGPIAEAVEEEQRPTQLSDIDFARLEEEHQRQLDELRWLEE